MQPDHASLDETATQTQRVDGVTPRKVLIWVAATYVVALGGVWLKATAQSNEVPANVWQLLALLLFPVIWGILPIALALIYLAFKRLRVSEAWNGLRILWLVYIVVLVFRLLSPRPL